MGQCCAKGDKSSNRRKWPTSWGEDSYYPPEHLFAHSAAKAGGYSIPGWSNGAAKTNQDRGLLVLNFAGNSEQTMMLVCDGHGPDGHHASQGVVDAFLSEVARDDLLHDCRAAGLEKLTDILTRAVYEAEETTFIKKREGRSSGTTFTMAIICGTDLLFTANVGDSRSAIGTVGSDGKAGGHDLTVDHAAAHNAPECQRIIRAGGKISSFGGSQRVLSPGGDCALCPTRSVGDCEFGRDVVICTPEVVQHKLGPEDKYIVVASDGLWEFLKCSQVMAELNSHDHVSAASLNLVDFSQHEWFTTCGGYCDDITLVVAELPIKGWSGGVPGNEALESSTGSLPSSAGGDGRECSTVQMCNKGNGAESVNHAKKDAVFGSRAKPVVIKAENLASNHFDSVGNRRKTGR